MALVFLGIGSNLQREKHVRIAIDALTKDFGELRLSPIYETEAVGFTGPPFLNLVAWIETELSLAEVQRWCKNLEAAHGRELQAERYSSKTLDIDILLYNHDCVEATADTPQLPRDEVLLRAYVLRPLADLVPYMTHPRTGISFLEHWKTFQRSSNTSLTPVPFEQLESSLV
ncbi:MAG: 2-amino-4-hydroxy-6-hydroxymethyldihydropteridine diphosphokinase [Idiomarina sp.]|nr:2-amino-4-hydroxy-6-hydroxymethyldihydropteridine diphosphokinase [Idiomarina sp.]